MIGEEIKASARRPTNVLERIEAAIVARLAEQMPGRIDRIEAFSDLAADYDFGQKDRAAIFVQLSSSAYSASDDAAAIRVYAPHRTLTWSIYLLVRSIKGAQAGSLGSYEGIEEIRCALQGVSFCGATAMRPLGETLDAQVEGGWRWKLQFSNSIPAVSRPPMEH